MGVRVVGVGFAKRTVRLAITAAPLLCLVVRYWGHVDAARSVAGARRVPVRARVRGEVFVGDESGGEYGGQGALRNAFSTNQVFPAIFNRESKKILLCIRSRLPASTATDGMVHQLRRNPTTPGIHRAILGG